MSDQTKQETIDKTNFSGTDNNFVSIGSIQRGKDSIESSKLSLDKIKKRSGQLVDFDIDRIKTAVSKAFDACNISYESDIDSIVQDVYYDLQVIQRYREDGDFINVETVQDTVEKNLIKYNKYEVAKAYILYRDKRASLRRREIFKKRTNLKPYEYPELYEYATAIRHSYRVHTEFNYLSDVQDFKININDAERNAIKNTMLAIAQIEVNVKAFWGDIYKRMPKPEIAAVGFTFAESEVRHMDAYSHLLEILGLNEEFEKISHIPALMERVKYLSNALKNSKSEDNRDYVVSVLLFSLFIEHVSLFSQFLIMMSFNKYRNLFKGISNAVEATSKEEQIHGLFGIEIVKLIRQEHPEWFDKELEADVIYACKQAFESEKIVLDRIFEQGELEFLPKNVVLEFVKNRLNNSLKSVGYEPIFDIDDRLVDQTDRFDDEIIATKHGDFFVKRSINYNKRSKSITANDLF